MAEGELRDNDEFPQLKAGGDGLLAELGEVVLVRTSDLLDQPVQAQALEQARDLARGFAG